LRRFPHLPKQLLRNHLNLLDVRVEIRLFCYVTLVGFGLLKVELVNGQGHVQVLLPVRGHDVVD
jgi:hypothetical protein